jgi:hypothetical protein
MKTIKSFGCSFIFGSDLSDDGKGTKFPTASQLTWPAHLARYLNRNYECYARPGSGNLQILERLLNQISESDSSDLIVVGWSWIDRFDYYDPHHDPKTKLTPWSTIMPIDEHQLAKTYYKNLHSEYKDKFSSLICIKSAIDALDQRKIPFIMTYMDRLLFDQQWHVSPAILHMQMQIKPHMTMFDQLTFLEWSRKNNYPESAAWHPLEDAHRAAFELIKSHSLV